jgi:hypothetical protein
MRRERWVMRVALLAWLAVPAAGAAQTLSGRLVDRETGGPVAAAFVILRDSAGAEAGSALGDPDGRFVVRATRPGRFTVQVERLGYRTFAADTVELEARRTVQREFRIGATAVMLPAIEVSATTRCRGRRELAVEAAAIWEEVRKALTVARWTGETGQIRYEVVRWERRLNPRNLHVLRERNDTATLVNARSPYVSSLPARELVQGGFAREDSGYWVWDGPDADVLLSDDFLDAHCFRAATDRARPALVGLAFEPAAGTKPAIRGTLWIDRASFELRFVEFTYVRLPWNVNAPAAGGRVAFRRLPGGGFIVESWWLRSPLVSRALGQRRYSLDAYLETGQEVRAMTTVDGRSVR